MTENGETTVCPECKGTGILSRVGPRSGGNWYCRHCNEHFEEPDTRPKEWPDGWSGLTQELAQADPENWP
jgi:ribosomal protein L37AE/L43A